VVCLNVLEHVRDPLVALQNMSGALVPGGRLVLYVPRGPALFSTLDEALGHRCRYDVEMLESELAATGFELEHLTPFNRFSVPGWWWNGKILRRRTFTRPQLKILDVLVPIVRRLDRFVPWAGLGIIAVARRP
jgi:SAM-dependent methyltransferase